ncbi:MAG: hypothetical protein ACO1N3_02115 [Gammaproteobacteria bacterium]
MKKVALALLSMGLFFSLPSYAQYSATSGEGTTDEDTLTKYVKNLSNYIGYDVDKGTSPVFQLLDYTLSLAQTGQQTLNVFFAARLLNPAFKEFTTNTNYSSFNKNANSLFANYKTSSTKNISVVTDFDQKSYQDDPASQLIANILKTPNTDTCFDTDDTCMSKNKVMYTVVQDIMDKDDETGAVKFPSESTYFNQDHFSRYSNALNSGNLTGPLQYSDSGDQKTDGLPSANQQLQAMNFIRYVTGAVLPADFMSATDYTALRTEAIKEINSSTPAEEIDPIKNARKDLMTYLLKSRVYAAQSSVPINTLVDMMTKRMPQKITSTDGATSTTTSQAFNEFVMATWRLFSPGIPSGEQWVDQINAASAATTQKEMAILLSEINYQLYLNRQIQERILLTNTVIALNSLTTNQPNSAATSTETPSQS